MADNLQETKQTVNPYLDATLLNTSKPFTPNKNAAFIRQHCVNSKGGMNGMNGHEHREEKEYSHGTFSSLENGFHSLLTALNLPISSEILVTSLVRPSLLRIIELHGLITKCIEIDLETMRPSSPIHMTDNSKVLLIGHLFGFTIEMETSTMNTGARMSDLIIIHDWSHSCHAMAKKDKRGSDIVMHTYEDRGVSGALFEFAKPALQAKVASVCEGYCKQSRLRYLSQTLLLSLRLAHSQNRYSVMIGHALGYERIEGRKKELKEFMAWLETQPCKDLSAAIECCHADTVPVSNTQKRSMLLSQLTAVSDITIIGRATDNSNTNSSQCVFPILLHRNCSCNRKRIIDCMRSKGYDVSDGHHSLTQLKQMRFETNVVYLPHLSSNVAFKQMLSTFVAVLRKVKVKQSIETVSVSVLSLPSSSLNANFVSFSFLFKILAILLLLRYVWYYILIVMAIAYYFLRPTRIFRDTPYKGVRQRTVRQSKVCAIITGATGFLGEVLVKDLLDSYPSDRIKLYLIIRAKKSMSAVDRAEQLFGEQVLADTRVSIIDAELDLLGEHDLDQYIDEPISQITHVIHSAGNVRFSDSHANVARINIECTLKLQKISSRYNARFVYVSTAFVHGADNSNSTNYITASPVHLSDDISAQKLYHLMLTNRGEVRQYMRKHSIENNYVLSKMIAETLLYQTDSDCGDTVIVRPSIITPAWNFPSPAWGGRTPSTITLVVAGVAGRLIRAPLMAPLSGHQSMPIVPVDFVTKVIIDSMSASTSTSNTGVVFLAALNTQTKYTKVLSFWEGIWTFTSYAYGMEILTSIEVVLIRLCVMAVALMGSLKVFKFIGYFMNELFAPKQYRSLLRVVYEFKHFAYTRFEVTGGITPGPDFDGKKYTTMIYDSAVSLAKKPINDLTATIPWLKYDHSLSVSVTNTCFSYILKKTCNQVVIDSESLNKLKDLHRFHNSNTGIVLLPSHRSFYDFLLVCKMCVKYQMYGLSMPLSFATSKFKQSPLIACVMQLMNTIFIDSGSNNIKNGFLAKKVRQHNHSRVYQLFLEGSRSRNRQYLAPHHGALSILAQEMDLTLVPITINYERVPEQDSFYRELDGEKVSFSAIKLFAWFYRAIVSNTVRLGDINIRIGDVMHVKRQSYNKQFFSSLVNRVQARQMEMTNITRYHIRHFEKQTAFAKFDIAHFLSANQCKVYPTTLRGIPDSSKEVYMLTLQFAHFISDYFDSDTKYWLTNGNGNEDEERKEERKEEELFVNCVKHIIDEYRSFNYVNQSSLNLCSSSSSSRIAIDEESLGYWGYKDCYFSLASDKLFFKGSRYEHMSDKSFDKTLSFLSQLSNLPLLRKKRHFPVIRRKHVQTETNVSTSLNWLSQLFGDHSVSRDVHVRYRHGTGHTVSDMLHLRLNTQFRIPDIVVYPRNKEQLLSLIQNCARFGLCLIPYGGGTNVTHALWCPPRHIEERQIISVDMRKMNSIVWINRENCTAQIEAGITGKKLEKELNAVGFTSGHCPDSYEFSTLGGWIATYASGMKRAKYGNIESIVIDFQVLTAMGLVERNVRYGRVSSGSNPLLQFYGSEGNLGIIVAAVIRLRRIPDIVAYDSVVFPKWSNGVAMLKMVSHSNCGDRPASLRLVDNTQFKLSQTFKEEPSKWLRKLYGYVAKLYVTKWRRFDTDSICAATIVYEGNKSEVKAQKRMIEKLIRENNGISGGEASGKAGFNLTFAIAYIRDFLLETFGILAESFETFIPWDKVNTFKPSLHSAILSKHHSIGLIGNPFLSSRISQIYSEGVCLYLYYGFYVETINEKSLQIFDEMEEFIKKEMLELGGSISHHHGIGKLRSHILKNDISSKQMLKLTQNVKMAFDPNNIFCANNGLLNRQNK